ncbi:MAG: hypothetical protein OXG61_10730 [Chloroflexi bacterium]|nr:hypothetical protein [Chloroflexota bacterium]
MRFNPLNLFRQAAPEPVLLAVTPPRTGERTLLGVENLLSSIAVPEPFSLELAGDAGGVTLLARCRDGQVVRQQIAAHYPQARLQQLEADDDPLALAAGEQAWALRLRAEGPEYASLRVFADDALTEPGSDPLLALLGAFDGLKAGERLVARLRLRSLGPEWSRGHQERAHRPAVERPHHDAQTGEVRRHTQDGVAMALLALGGLGFFQGYRWWQAGEEWKTIALGAGVALALGLAGWAWARFRRSRNRVYDPLLIKEKVSRIAFEADVELVAVLPTLKPRAGRQRAKELLEPVAAAYRQYDHPAGLRLKAARVRPVLPDRAALHPAPPGLLRGRGVLGVREAAALWHPPGARDETPLVARSGAKVLLPSAREVSGGALVGATTAGAPQPIRFPDALTRSHHLYVARTRMGKSTLMEHLVVHRLQEKAAGRDRDAIVVIDPHADLVESILQQVPESLADQVRLVDLAGSGGYPGINLLDTRVFSDRDRTADSVVRVAKGLWEQWGPRMQSILEQVVKTLHEHNAHPETPVDEQYTILDGLRLLSDERFRNLVLERVTDDFLVEWWRREFKGWRNEYRADALAPVQTRLSYYASSRRARAVLGQSRSTVDLRRTILDGGVLLVSTAQGAAGRDVAALIGSSILNLVDAVIREQGALPPGERRGALVVVDEMQSMPGVDYESMLSELGKFGASFVLATQSLVKLDDLSPTMRDTLLANIGCLCVFQVAGSDARQLVWELDRERVSEEDIVSLPVHHAYVRATVGNERTPTFSMAVRKPEGGSTETAARIRAGAASYLLAEEEIAALRAEGKRRIDAWLEERRKREEERKAAEQRRKQTEAGAAPDAPPPPQPPGAARGSGQRSKHFQPPAGGSGEEDAA